MTFRKLLILSAIISGLQRIMGSGPAHGPVSSAVSSPAQWGASVVTLGLVIALHWHSHRCPTHNIAAATSIKIYIWTLFASVGKLKISINYHNIIPTASRPIKTGYLETVGRCWRLLLPGTKTLPPHQELPLCPVSQCCDDAGDTWWLVAGGWAPSSISASCHHHANHLRRARDIRAAARCWEQSPIICIFSHGFPTSHLTPSSASPQYPISGNNWRRR